MLRSAWRFRQFIRAYWLSLVGGALLVILGTIVDLVRPWPLKVIADGAISHQPQHNWLANAIAGSTSSPQTILLRALIAVTILVGLSSALAFVSEFLMNRAGQRIMMDIRGQLYAHIHRMSLAYHDRQRVGDLTSRVTTDIDRLQDMLVAIFDTLIPNLLTLLGLAIVMLLLDPGFGLLALSIAPLLFLVTYQFTLRIKQAARRSRAADAGVASLASETLAAVRAIQAFSREEHEDQRFAVRNHESFAAGVDAIRLRAAFSPLIDLVSLVGTLLILYVGTRRVLDGKMTLGLLLVFLSYLNSLYRPMRALSKLAYVISRGTASAERVAEVLEADHRLPERPQARSMARAQGGIEFRNVTFRYQADRDPVWRDVSVKIESGERVGIVGPTGAGKSTFVSLIPRFYDPDAGMVLIDGVDVRDLRLESVRRQASFVLQEPILFFGTILDNIRYGDPEAPMRRVWEVAEAANVTEFLQALPEGIDTVIGERGATLSGGQRQRIAIARAMLRDAPILILDEPTTGLDGAAEQLVLDGLRRLAEGRTTLVISHQTAPLVGVHRMLSVRDGTIVELPVPDAPARERLELSPVPPPEPCACPPTRAGRLRPLAAGRDRPA